jgi:hypothetical protein
MHDVCNKQRLYDEMLEELQEELMAMLTDRAPRTERPRYVTVGFYVQL